MGLRGALHKASSAHTQPEPGWGARGGSVGAKGWPQSLEGLSSPCLRLRVSLQGHVWGQQSPWLHRSRAALPSVTDLAASHAAAHGWDMPEIAARGLGRARPSPRTAAGASSPVLEAEPPPRPPGHPKVPNLARTAPASTVGRCSPAAATSPSCSRGSGFSSSRPFSPALKKDWINEAGLAN